MSRDYRLYLEDMLECSRKVTRYTHGMSFEQFLADERTFDAVLRNLEVIGEAARNVPDEVKDRYPGTPWARATGLRNIVAHKYFGADPEILWDVVSNHIPSLTLQLEHVIEVETRDGP